MVPRPVRQAVDAYLDLEDSLGGYEATDASVEAIQAAAAAVARLLGAHRRNIALGQNSTTGFAQALDVFDFASGRRDPDQPRRLRLQPDHVPLPGPPAGRGDRSGAGPRRGRGRSGRGSGARPAAPADAGGDDLGPHQLGPGPAGTGHRGDLSRGGDSLPGRRLPGGGADAGRRRGRRVATTSRARRASSSGVPEASDSFTSPTGRSRPARTRSWSTCTAPPGPIPTGSSSRPMRGGSNRGRFNYALVLGLGAAARYALDVGVETARDRARALAAYARLRLAEVPGVRVLDRGPELCAIVTAAAGPPVRRRDQAGAPGAGDQYQLTGSGRRRHRHGREGRSLGAPDLAALLQHGGEIDTAVDALADLLRSSS